jgi:hypothetical protein
MIRRKDAERFGAVKRLVKRTDGSKKKWSSGKERYGIIIASETDARKGTYGFNVTRRAVIAAAAGAALVIAAFAGLTVFSLFQSSYYATKADEMKSRIQAQASELDTYAGEIDSLGSALGGLRRSFKALSTNE